MNRIPAGLIRILPLVVLAGMLLPATAFGQAVGCSPTRGGVFFADVTGGGRADAIVVNRDGITVRRSNGRRFEPNELWTSGPFFGAVDGNVYVYFADVDGDGRADAIAVNETGITVRRSDGHSFRANEDWTREGYMGTDQRGHPNIYFADVTGEHRASAIVVNPDGIVVRRSNGRRFTGNEKWTEGPYYGERGTYFADVDGDGKADAIVVNRDGITVRRSDGTRFMPNELWLEEGAYRRNGGAHFFFADVDGDGRADAILVSGSGVTVYLSDGSQFGPPMRWTRNAYLGEMGIFFADVTGYGNADAIVVNRNGVTVRPSNGSRFVGNEPWTEGAYYGDFGPTCSGGRYEDRR